MAVAASFFNKEFKFGVVYDDDSFGDEAKKTKTFVKFMVTELEKELKKECDEKDEKKWRGYYTARDGLPGENKMTRYVTLAKRSEYLICVITNNFVRKGIPRFRQQMTQYIQIEDGKADAIIPVVYGITETVAREALGHEESAGDAPLQTMMVTEYTMVEDSYEETRDSWIPRIANALLQPLDVGDWEPSKEGEP